MIVKTNMPRWAAAFALVLGVQLGLVAGGTGHAAGARPGATAGGADAKSIHRDGAKTLDAMFREELALAKKQGKSVIVMFTADWCQPCKNVKEFLEESPVVQKAVKQGKFLYVDVDEWRGPAHQLIAGINPTQLPVLVNVDPAGKAVQSCFGTDLGLISDQAVAHNLGRLLQGKAPERLAYLDDSSKQRELIVEQAQKSKARIAHIPALDVQVRAEKDLGGGQRQWTIRLFIQNHDSRRRWFAFPARTGVPLSPEPQVESWQTIKFAEHVRATMMRFEADPPFYVIPLAGLGSVDLDGLVIQGAASDPSFEVWELNELGIGGQQAQFDKKVPFNLIVQDSAKTAPLGARQGAVVVKMPPGTKKSVTLKK